MPHVTVIIPTYNRGWAVRRAIESCRDGDGSLDIQIIVVDDGSTDDTEEVLSRITGIEVYSQKNWGKPWAVNLVLEKVTGDYIKFLDSDDWLVSGSLTAQYQLARQTGADVIVAGYNLHNEDGFVATQPWVYCDDFIAQNLGECDSSHYSAFLFKRQFVAEIPHRTSFAAADFASRDDRCFMLEVALKEPAVAVFKQPALNHLTHTKGRLQFQSGLKSACTNYQHLLIYKNIIRQLQATDRLTLRRRDAACKILWPLAHWIARDSLKDGKQVVKWIRKLNPKFQVPDAGITGFLYKQLGFDITEKIMRTRRLLKNGWM